MKRLLPVLALLLLAALPGCPNDDTGDDSPGALPVSALSVIGPVPGGTADADGGAPVNLTVTGTVSYDRLVVTPTGLDLLNPVTEAAVDVVVEAVAHNDIHNVLANTATDANGDFTLNFSTAVDYFIRARAKCGSGADVDRVFHSQTVPPVIHAAPGPVLNRAAGSQVVNLHAAADPTNRAGAFAILDTARRLRAACTVTALGPLDLFWGMGNAGTQWLKDGSGKTITLSTETGLNGPAGNPSVYLLGGSAFDLLNSDHDEFDETVIAHEWASFLQLTQSRDNNFGGPHFGEELLVSAAYSEGVVTAIGCALLGQRVYRDTYGCAGGITGVQFEFDCESGSLVGTGMGYGNEFQVTRVCWDLLDGGAGSPPDSDADPAAIALVDLLSSFTDLKTRAAPYEVAWLASLLQELIDDARLSALDADTIMGAHGGVFPPAAGDSFPEVLTVGAPAINHNLDAYLGSNPNPVLGPQANGVWRLELAASQSITIDVTNTTAAYDPAAHRLDLSLHDLSRNIVAQHVGDAASKTMTVSLAAGTYIVRVQHSPASQLSSAPVTFSIEAQ